MLGINLVTNKPKPVRRRRVVPRPRPEPAKQPRGLSDLQAEAEQAAETQETSTVEAYAKPYDHDAETREMKAADEAAAATMKDADKLVEDLITLLLPARDMEVFNWMLEVLQVSKADLFKQILRAAIVRERRNHREAMGGGGASSQNLEKLQERI